MGTKVQCSDWDTLTDCFVLTSCSGLAVGYLQSDPVYKYMIVSYFERRSPCTSIFVVRCQTKHKIQQKDNDVLTLWKLPQFYCLFTAVKKSHLQRNVEVWFRNKCFDSVQEIWSIYLYYTSSLLLLQSNNGVHIRRTGNSNLSLVSVLALWWSGSLYRVKLHLWPQISEMDGSIPTTLSAGKAVTENLWMDGWFWQFSL